ncbi:hypothetical protein [Eubacterium sp. An3]|uniref:hypothetical protein n=1 Tax=Eubacterium sp. An3 TaxID=1965628 RepID=UPI000B377A90|nr:hypothetical protein [Eubacterium sp. An3]OUO24791.1 hypothetical protein B5F87_19140 [Eubacterium sp. An3]
MHDLDKVFNLVNTFLVSSSFFDILRKQLFFPENIHSIHSQTFSVREIESVDEMERIELLAKKYGFYPTDYLFVLKDPSQKESIHPETDFIPFSRVVLAAFRTFAQDSTPLIYPQMWKGKKAEKYSDEERMLSSGELVADGMLVLQLMLLSIPLSMFLAKARETNKKPVRKEPKTKKCAVATS